MPEQQPKPMPTAIVGPVRAVFRLAVILAVVFVAGTGLAGAQQDQVLFPATTNTIPNIVSLINNEKVRIDISAWYLTEHAISQAIVNRFLAGVPVRIIGDRVANFEVDPNTKHEFYYLANYGVPIRLRYNPTWFPEIDHWKVGIFVGQGAVEFGSANWATYELSPASSTNYPDETMMITTDPVLFGAFETKFDIIWNDTTTEPESLISGPPYLKNWWDACALESACSDYYSYYPSPAPMSVNTARLAPNNYLPPDLIWGQGPDFNNRLVTEINNETSQVKIVVYRLTVPTITNALLSKYKAGVPVRVIIDPDQYLNRKWPEFWLTHAYVDSLWAAGIPVMQRAHNGITHMKLLVTSNYATNASSNFAAAWQRDNDYFVSATGKPTIYQAMSSIFDQMWNNSGSFAGGFKAFVPGPPDAPTLASPSSGASSVSTTPTLTWNTAVFATSYDVYVGTSTSNMTFVGNVAAQLTNNPPSTYSLTPSLQGGTTYYWQVIAKTNATVRNSSLIAASPIWSFTTSGSSGGTTGSGGTTTSPLPSGWANQDIGSVGVAGSSSYSSGVFTVKGAGSDIWGSSDSFQYAYTPFSGDGQIVARVTSETNTSTYAKAGVMFRETLGSNATNVILDLNPSGNVEFMARNGTGASTTWLAGASMTFPGWLKLVRSGNTFTGYVSSDGSTWSQVGSVTVTMASGAYTGLAVTSHTTSALNTATFDNVSTSASSGSTSSLPSPWQQQDVGTVGVTGSGSYSNGIFTVTGAGSDIWGTSDSFHYVYQPISGDTQIVARVTSEQNTNTYAKAGVMFRETLASNATNVILDVTPSGNVEFMVRNGTGASTVWLGGANQPIPTWLKLVRSGSTFTAYVSADGTNWTTVGTTSVTMASSAYKGLVVTSHTTSATNTSTFDNVQ